MRCPLVLVDCGSPMTPSRYKRRHSRFGLSATGCAFTSPRRQLLEHLRAIRGTLSDHAGRLNRIELRLSGIEQTLGGLYALSGSDRETLSGVIRRVERIERRLELSDHPA